MKAHSRTRHHQGTCVNAFPTQVGTRAGTLSDSLLASSPQENSLMLAFAGQQRFIK